jgi:hypothetical protein
VRFKEQEQEQASEHLDSIAELKLTLLWKKKRSVCKGSHHKTAALIFGSLCSF